MASRKYPYHRLKTHRTYSLFEAAQVLGSHRNTIRNWIRQGGLKPIDDGKPILVSGKELKRFLKDRRENAKRPCVPGTMYCLRCRTGRRPANGSVRFVQQRGSSGLFKATCEDCSATMNRRGSLEKADAQMPGCTVTVEQADRHIRDIKNPSSICHFSVE